MSNDELVSASVDSTVKMWDMNRNEDNLIKTLSGHTKDKNFVGLSATPDYITC